MRLPRHPRKVRLSAMPLLHLVPNMLTIMGLGAGMTSIRYALDGRYELAVALIGAAVVLDGLDGNSARMFNLTSKLGAQLDSLADFLSFGVAPAMLVYLWVLHDVRGVGWALAMLFAICCAFRLARFNTELEQPDRPRWTYHFFTGIPAPAAAGLALTPVMLSFVVGEHFTRWWVLAAVYMVLVAAMMVSRVPTYSVKRIRIAPEMVLPVLVVASIVIAGLVVETWLTLCVISLIYLGSIPFAVLSAHRLQQRETATAAGHAATPPAAAASPAPAATEPAEPAPTRVVNLGERQQRPS